MLTKKREYLNTNTWHQLSWHIDNIVWETEIWIEANPAHMIHFNGPKFLTVYE